MKQQVIKSTFSLFGNFSKIVTREADLQKAFADYKFQSGQETLPNGMPAKVYHFVNEHKAVTIHAYRIDFDFGYPNDNITTADFQAHCEEAANTLAKVDTIKANRIAYNSIEFIDNPEGSVVAKCNELFNIANVFGSPAKEFNLRVNHVKTINGEEFNSVLILQDGAVTHNVTKENKQVLFVNKDINTLINHQEPRFTLNKVDSYVGDLLLEAADRNNTFFNAVEGETINK